jgi:S1-C subfamily serine protease
LSRNGGPKTGEKVIVIGNPSGLDRTVTEGIVSANRRVLGDKTFLQISAPVNPGNSGGPVLNYRSEVVGVVSSKLSWAEGIAFAVPVSEVNKMIEDYRSNPPTMVR